MAANPNHRVSRLSKELRGSAILRIAGEVRAMVKDGKEIVDLTVGDFSSKHFRIPRELEDGIVDALRAGESTYPPPNGLESLRLAVREFYQRRLGLDLPARVDSHLSRCAARHLRALPRRRRSGRPRRVRRAVLEQRSLLPDPRRGGGHARVRRDHRVSARR